MITVGTYQRRRGIEGGAAPSQAAPQGTSASDVSDGATACPIAVPVEKPDLLPALAALGAGAPSPAAHSRRSGRRAKLDVDFGTETLQAVRARADRLGLSPGVWVKAVVRDALRASRTTEFDAAVAAAAVRRAGTAAVSGDAHLLASQIRPLAINVNDLDRRARAGDPIAVDQALLTQLATQLHEVRSLLGDRRAR